MKVAFALPFLWCAFAAHAQQATHFQHRARTQEAVMHQQTTPANSRYEIIQSSIAAKWTFRLDKQTGRVWRLAELTNGDSRWDEMPVTGAGKPHTTGKAHFQIYMSGLAAQYTFLIDTDTGKTWVAVMGTRQHDNGTEYEIVVWQPFAADRGLPQANGD
jgi:hypothetical protein